MLDDDLNTQQSSPEIDDLLKKYSLSRDDLVKDLSVITSLKDKIELLLPQEINFKNKYLLDEKLKIFSNFFSSMLSIRQEINKSIMQEIEIRRKISPPRDKGALDSMIRSIAEKIEGIGGSKHNNIDFPSDISDVPTHFPPENTEIDILNEKEQSK
jgi:hypothetical protein